VLKKTVTALIVLVGLILLPTLAQAVCSYCYTACSRVNTANNYATLGIPLDEGCPDPWSGTEYSVSINLTLALADGEDAEDLLWDAYMTCDSDDAEDGLAAAIAARNHAYNACYGDVCQDDCPDNPICPYACNAYARYQLAVSYAADCVDQTQCPGTEAKWQSDYHNQTPHLSSGQPSPPVCLSTDRCLYSTGSSAARGTVNGGHWLCSAQYIDGRSQGVWYLCESTREAAGVTMEGLDCVYSGGVYLWQ